MVVVVVDVVRGRSRARSWSWSWAPGRMRSTAYRPASCPPPASPARRRRRSQPSGPAAKAAVGRSSVSGSFVLLLAPWTAYEKRRARSGVTGTSPRDYPRAPMGQTPACGARGGRARQLPFPHVTECGNRPRLGRRHRRHVARRVCRTPGPSTSRSGRLRRTPPHRPAEIAGADRRWRSVGRCRPVGADPVRDLSNARRGRSVGRARVVDAPVGDRVLVGDSTTRRNRTGRRQRRGGVRQRRRR